MFDPIAAAESWINTELDLLFNPERLARLIDQSARATNGLALPELFDAVEKTAARTDGQSGPQREIARALEKVYVNHLLKLAIDKTASQQVVAFADQRIDQLQAKLQGTGGTDPAEAAQKSYLAHQIEQLHRDSKALEIPKPPRIPDGSPIGSDE